VGNSPTIYVDPTGMFWEGFAEFIDERVNQPIGQFIADNPLVEDAVRIADSVAVGVSQTANLVGFDIRGFREDIYGEGVNDNLNEAVVTVSTVATFALGGYALSGLAAGSLGKVAATSINTGLFNTGFGLTTQLLFNGGDSRQLDYNSLRLDFAFGALGARLGFGVTARVGGGFATQFAVSTAFEGTFAGLEQVGRNLIGGERWNQGVPESIISSILFQGASEALSNPRQALQAGRRLWRGAENLKSNKVFSNTKVINNDLSSFNLTRDSIKVNDNLDSFVPGCFIAGTKVLTQNGNKSIETLQIDDIVVSTNPETGEIANCPIYNRFRREVPIIVELSVGKTTIICSPEHPFWVANHGWKKAGDLKVRDRLITKNKESIEIRSILLKKGCFTVYNIEVKGLHTYHVSPLSILVHNKALSRPTGLRERAQRNLDKYREIQIDPLGEINSLPNHNHFDAARREAAGQIVAYKPDGTPFDHIGELQDAYRSLVKIRQALADEMKLLPDTLTPRGLELLKTTYPQVQKDLSRLKNFLQKIGHLPSV